MNDTPKIVGDKPRAEAFIPAIWSEALAIALRPSEFTKAWKKSPEGQAAMARWKQEAEKAAAERQQVLARHAELVAAETHPVLAALLAEHTPTETNGQFICRACPAGTDPFGDEVPALAPCPTWKSIEAGA